ncbi:unnamed protein product [Mytilus coruscus]|uniref:Arrestin C-terminal-like domain-containing protein n=1 Tax=Mytilus coruscus TaxID=42192 RepID=A0A6J8CLT2_MYTCO|nr:unnamed protein product [Mytilus coruscus]
MDYIKQFEIELDKDVYYAGETLSGCVLVKNTENVKVQGIRLVLRGKAHVEWRITKAGERRTVRDDEYYIDEKKVIWGKDKHEDGGIPIMPRGNHRYNFQFKLPESALPSSFESKIGTIRYYIRMTMDIPYSSSPQGIKYFTIVGPHIDCMEEKYLTPTRGSDKRNSCCLCCNRGPVSLQAELERSAYCCGENLRLKATVQNGSSQEVWLFCKLVQIVDFFINKGVLGLSKSASHRVWEYKGENVCPDHSEKFDNLHCLLQVPIMPPTIMLEVCSVIQISYELQVCLIMADKGQVLELDFPITVATAPYRVTNAPFPILQYDHAITSVEGGMYVSSEFQLGQVYIGEGEEPDDEVILYRPVYVCVPHEKIMVTNIDREGHMSRAGSRISMTRLNDRKFQLDSRSSKSRSEEIKREDSITDSPVLERSRTLLSPDSASIDRGSDNEVNKTPSEDISRSEPETPVSIPETPVRIPETPVSIPEISKSEEVTLHLEDMDSSVTDLNTFKNCNGTSVKADICKESSESVVNDSVVNKTVSQIVETPTGELNDSTETSNCKKMYANDEPANIKCDHTPDVILVRSDQETTELSEKT